MNRDDETELEERISVEGKQRVKDYVRLYIS